jgi:hypothetical protein
MARALIRDARIAAWLASNPINMNTGKAVEVFAPPIRGRSQIILWPVVHETAATIEDWLQCSRSRSCRLRRCSSSYHSPC